MTGIALITGAAGVLRRPDEYQPDVFADVLDINLVGGMRLATACKPALAKRPPG
jgi:NAD(P)-dependent dehydrogenase (short-subunit alcohol dehydrogenase family)